MSTRLSMLTLHTGAAWSDPAKTYLPARVVINRATLCRVRSRRRYSFAKPRLQPLRRPSPFRSATLHSNADSCVDSVGTQHIRTTVDDAVLIQGFGWTSCDQEGWYDQIKLKVHDLKGYLPAQLYNLSSCYGNKEQLQSLTWTLNHVGIKPIADIVINHRCADVQNENGIWNSYRDDVHHHGRRIDWGDWAVCRDDWHFGGTGALKTGASYHPAPDLDHTNDELRAALKDWLLWLRHEMGFMGWRFDFVKGYAPKYVKEYVDAVSLGEPLHLAEFWVDMRWFGNTMDYDQDAPRQVLCDWISASGTNVTAFDFPTKGILQEAVKYTQYDRLRDKDGRAPGLLGWWPQKACTFIDNHDTGSTQQHWPFPETHVGLGYAYILTHPGVPCIAWEHMWDTRLTFIIKQLMRLRKRQDIHAGSKLEILCADRTMYVARIDDRVVVKLGPQQDMGILLPKPTEGWRLCLAGHDFAAWEKSLTELPSGTSGNEPAGNNVVSSEPNP